MRKIIFYIVIISFLLPVHRSFGQTVDKGRESAKGEVNVSAVAAYLTAHPEPPATPTIDNDEDNDTHPPRTIPPDPSKVYKRGIMPPVPLISLPVSPSPTDTFESTLDPGTAIPPDTHGAVDANYCMTVINTTVKIQTRAGAGVSSISLNSFWTSLVSGGAYDPRIHYDPYSGRWIFITDAGAEAASSALLVAVSKTGDPTGSWWTYKITADKTGVDWLDFPQVGFNKKWITVTGNMFSVASNSYDGAKMFVFDKDSVMTGVSAPFTSFYEASSFTLCPALTYDTAEINMFVIESWDGTNSGGGLMQLWKIAGVVGSETFMSVGFPESAGFNWQQSSFAAAGPTPGADFAPQSGTSDLLQTNDDRVDQMIQMNHKLWFAHTVFLPFSFSVNPTRASIQWWQTDTLGSPIQIGTIDDATNTNFYAFPALAVNTSDDALIGFGAFSGSTHPSGAYALRLHTDPVDSIRPLQIYRHGQSAYYKTFSGTKDRWGDYSGAVMDPVDQTGFWTIQEASASSANTWDTWWAHVQPCAAPAVITGTMDVCPGAATTISDDTTGGIWTSSNTLIATIGSTTGNVTGITGGTASITYTINGGCTAVSTFTVNPLPGTISGATAVCTTLTTGLSDAGGGTWTSGSTGIATISGAGLVTGVSTGTSIITYTLATGCINTTTVTVSTLPGTITGTPTVCTGNTTSLSDGGGGTWASDNTSIATVALSSGIVTGVGAGAATITYSLGSGCAVTTGVTVNLSPAGITGTRSVCTGSTTTLSDGTGGGAWSSGSTGIATVASGVVTGISGGTSAINYILAGGCTASATVTVNPAPAAITGTPTLCAGASTALTDATGGGVWSSDNTSVATVASGVVTGVAAGNANIIYTLGGLCSVTYAVTVNPAPVAITGAPTLCVGLTTALSDITSGGAWASSNTAVATVSGGLVMGLSGGTTDIAYTLGGGCAANITVTVSTSAPAISGLSSVCEGLTTSLSDAGGGTWASANTAVATVGLGTGVVTGLSLGTSAIIYTLGAGCTASVTVTVNLSASAITGTTTVCAGATTTLSDPATGGAWSSGATGIATVVAGSGVVTGVAPGTSIITYSIGVGCTATTVVTVKPSPAAITGPANVCLGSSVTLSDAGGGTWLSTSSAIASIGVSSGIVSGLSLGSSLIVYTLSGCSATTSIAVVPLPAIYTVTGGGAFCAGGAGEHVGLAGSDAGVNYQLYNGTTLVSILPGTTSSLDFGLQTGAGAYTVVAVNGTSGCVNNMAGSAAITVTALATPSVSITAVPGDTICATGHVTFIAAPVSGGSSPSYQWTKNSINIATGPTYIPVPIPNNGDIIGCTLTSDYSCLTTPTAVSSPLTIYVDVVSKNYDSVKVTDMLIAQGQVDTFVAIVTHGGTSPTYQWYINNIAVPGATNATYITDTLLNGQKVKCLITSSDECTSPQTGFTNVITMTVTTGVNELANGAGKFTLVPNPNEGEFTINGTMNSLVDEQVSIVVTDMVGQTIYTKTVRARNGALNEHIKLQSSVAGGVYLVKIASGEDHVVFHVVINK